ncbi:MAG: metallophosphoesterase [Chthoniobacter sp.]|uniref:metallophosphoesterase n=1 Tax=Chthoniobacter sp. TaxID=2510640 RepID=UPI0032ACBE41
MKKSLFFGAAVLLLGLTARGEDIQRIWLTHRTNDPSKIVVNWQTTEPANSIVEYGDTDALGQTARQEEAVALHHVEIPLAHRDGSYHYRVRSGSNASAVHAFQGYPSNELRVAVVADTGYGKSPWGEAVQREKPHLLISAGDHVPALHKAQPVAPTDTTAFGELVDRYRELFSSTPWMPLLGNHDREMSSRGPKPPPEPVYDVEATAFRAFFALPGDQWKWHFDVPEFGVRFIALDFSHLSDQGSTWQTCHSPKRAGPQFGWYRDLMAASQQPFVLTFDNERNATVRSQEGGEWGRMMAQGSLTITGFGYFAERAEVDGITYYNTSVGGNGTPYPDPKSAVFKSEDNYILLTFRREPRELRVDLKDLRGEVLDSKTFAPRVGAAP